MSCVFCSNYQGLNTYCFKGVMVRTLSESIDCKDYVYDGSCNVDGED